MIQNLIVGAGLSGTIIAQRLASIYKQSSLIIDQRSHIGGNCYDYEDKNINIIVHKYGPHTFHTNNKEVWDYLSLFTKWHYFMPKAKANIDGNYINIPFNLNSLYKAFPKNIANNLENKLISKFDYNHKLSILELLKTNDKDLKFLANYIYEKIFKNYTIKQWGINLDELDLSVGARVPIIINKDDRYFQNIYQAIPKMGYTAMIKNILNNKLIKIKLNTRFKDIKKDIKYKRLIFTGSIDEFFDYKFGNLEYRSLDIVFENFNKEYFQDTVQINYPNNYDFTRIVEYKYFLNQKSNKTLISYEYPCSFNGKNERYYPILNTKNKLLYEKYLNEAKKLKNVYFIGRLGDYKYYNMDEIIARALKFANILGE